MARMASRDRFFIGPIASGLQTDVKPWLIPDDAFELLIDAYVFRGRVKKKFGTYLMNESVNAVTDAPQMSSRLRVSVGTTDGTGFISGTVPGTVFKVGQQFSIKDEIFTVNALGTPGTMLTTGVSPAPTFDTTTGAFIIAAAATTAVTYFYPSEPVMGITNLETPIVNFESTIAWDTQFAYQFSGGFWARIGTGATGTWTGNNHQLFWASNYRGITSDQTFLYATNFNVADGIRYWDGVAWVRPVLTFNIGGDTIKTCRIILPFKDRLVLLNTIETVSAVDKSFVNRCRFSQNGDPLQSDAWQEKIPAGKGGFIDTPIKQQIISAQIIRDRLIVFFERSTWELVYTGNQILPFRWQQINSELGVESPFSVVPFDKVAIGIGNVGIHACNGASVERIDSKIPDSIFRIHELENATDRVYGIRDYFAEMVYWTFPTSGKFSNKILAYNYSTKSWAFFNGSFTAFGYYQPNIATKTWNSSPQTWLESLDPWADPQFQARFRSVIAGNQQGLVVVLDPGLGRNAPSLYITDISSPAAIFTIVDHNLINGNFILIEGIVGGAGMRALNGKVFIVLIINSNSLSLIDPISGAKIVVTDTYSGGGRFSRISQIDIKTKQYNFYVSKGRVVNLSKVDFLVEKTEKGEITVDSFVSTTGLSLREGGIASDTLLGNSVLETRPFDSVPIEDSQKRLWHAVYFQAEGQSIQLRFYHTNEQLNNIDIAHSAFELHAMIFHTMPASDRL
jgi:hypothetical protein